MLLSLTRLKRHLELPLLNLIATGKGEIKARKTNVVSLSASEPKGSTK